MAALFNPSVFGACDIGFPVYDQAKAKQGLAELGYRAGKDGILEKDGRPLSLTHRQANAGPTEPMGTLPTIYSARSDVRPEHLDRVNDWYTRRHAPDLVRAGFYRAQVYHSEVGSPLVCNLYEIPGPDLFLTPAYRDVAANDAEGPAVIAMLTDRSNTAYDQVVTVGVPRPKGDWSRGDRTGAVEAASLTTARFDLHDADERALLEWYETSEGPRLGSRRGFRAGRVCRRGRPHPSAPSRDPRWFVINEWEDLGAALDDGTGEVAGARYAAAFPGRLSHFLYNVGRRVFRLP